MTIEEHRKEIRGRLVSMMKCAQESRGHPELHTAAVYDMGVLLSHLADIADISSQRLERQTQTLIRLTWGLFWLTLALAFVAAIQLYIMLK